MLMLMNLLSALRERTLRAAKLRVWITVGLLLTVAVLGTAAVAIYRAGENHASSSSTSSDYSTDGDYSSTDTSTTLAEDWRQLALSYGYPYGAAYAANDAAVDTWAHGVCADVLNYPSETTLANVYFSNTTNYPLTWSQTATAINTVVSTYCPSYRAYVYWY